MALIGAEIIVMLVILIVELFFIAMPIKMLGWLNLLVGFAGLISCLFIMAGYVTTSYMAWFGLIPVFCGIACILRADGISKL